MNPIEFRDHIIRPVLHHLHKTDQRLADRAVENLLLGTAIAESRLTHLVQIGGPAVSMFQIEPMTFDDVYNRYLKIQRTDLLGAVNGLLMPAMSPMDQLTGNQHFACAVARIRFWMVPEPLPEHDDIDGLGRYWKKHYNTPLGAGKAHEWAALYRKFVKGER